MLNFNRTFEQEMLYKIESPFADDIVDNNGNSVPPKSVEDSIVSFLSMMEMNMRKDLENYPSFREARFAEKNEGEFMRQFKKKYHLNPRSGDPLTENEIEELG
jgi:predicted metal-dependent hydrolase